MIRMKGAILVGYIVHSGDAIKYVLNYGGLNFKGEPLAYRPALCSWNMY